MKSQGNLFKQNHFKNYIYADKAEDIKMIR